ncbi:VOC family protein [Agromyces soli]
MALFDHLGISVADLPRSIAQYDPVMTALGCTRRDADDSVSWSLGEEELILFPARDAESGPHEHGQVGWQHLAFAVDSRDEVDRLHAIAVEAGWTAVREPKLYPRFNERYYATFIEDDNGIRLEFMHNPPRETAAQSDA